MKIRVTILFLFFLLSSCEKEELINNEFRVVVKSTTDLSCKLSVIRFVDKKAEVNARTVLETLTYNVYHLDN